MIVTTFLKLLLSNLIVETPTAAKNDLRKKPTKEDRIKNVNCWIQRNFPIIALAAIVFLLIFFVGFCFVLYGVSTVESGNYYYHLKEVI